MRRFRTLAFVIADRFLCLQSFGCLSLVAVHRRQTLWSYPFIISMRLFSRFPFSSNIHIRFSLNLFPRQLTFDQWVIRLIRDVLATNLQILSVTCSSCNLIQVILHLLLLIKSVDISLPTTHDLALWLKAIPKLPRFWYKFRYFLNWTWKLFCILWVVDFIDVMKLVLFNQVLAQPRIIFFEHFAQV